MVEEWRNLSRQIHTAEHADQVINLLMDINTYEKDTRWRVLASALNRLQELEYPDYSKVLLEQCALRSGYEGHIIDQMLKEWLRYQPVQEREVISRRLMNDLESPEKVKNVLWTFITLGTRSSELEDKLLTFVNHPTNEEIRIIALWGLVWLGYPNEGFLEDQLAPIVDQNVPLDNSVIQSGRLLASKRLYPHFRDRFRMSQNESQAPVELSYVLADTAYAHPDLAAEVWDVLQSLPETVRLSNVLTFWTGIAERIEEERVVDFFIGQLNPDDPAQYLNNNLVSPHYRLYLKLRDLYLPEHLVSFRSCSERISFSKWNVAIEALHMDATVNTHFGGIEQTGLTYLKDYSWDVALRLNPPMIREWIKEALNETNPHVAADICRIAGFLRVHEAVPKLRESVSRDDWGQESGLHIAVGLAALEALGAIGTYEALEALGESRVIFLRQDKENTGGPENTPQTYSDALSACVRTIEDAQSLLPYLEEGPTKRPSRWVACAVALHEVAALSPPLVIPLKERLFALLQKEEITQSEYLAYLLPVYGYLDADEDDITLLLNWARTAEHLLLPALEPLARWGVLAQHDDLLVRIGLIKSSIGEWRIVRHVQPHEAFIIGLLYDQEPTKFYASIVGLLEDGSYREALQVMQLLTPDNVVPEVLKAIAARAHRINQPTSAESEVLLTMVRLDPKHFTDAFRYEVVANWHAAAREAVVYGYSEVDPTIAREALVPFLTDPVYLIRRAAARSLSKSDGTLLQVKVAQLLESTDPATRRCGFEASVWLEEENDFNRFVEIGKHDTQDTVRIAAREAYEDRRRVSLGKRYLAAMMKTPSQSLLDSWHYGQALRHVGDDGTLLKLEEACQNPENLPHYTAYLKHLYGEIAKGWKERQDKRKDRSSE